MSSIDNAKAAMGYIPAKQRAACSNCPNAEFRDCIHPTWWCTPGGFLVGPMAICDKHPSKNSGVAS